MSDLSELELNVDINVASPDDYIDNTAPLLPIGSYTLRLLDYAFEPSKTEGKPPAVLLKQIEVAEGPLAGRRISFQRVYATPFTRKNATTGQEEKASGLADFIRSVDRTFPTDNMTLPDVRNFLNKVVDERLVFHAKADHEGFDADFNKHLRELAGIPMNDYRSAKAKEIGKQVTIRGKQFEGKGSVINPLSGNKVEARVKLTNFYPSRD